MLEIGLTGGIGSGKTTAAKAFEAVGYRVYYADDRAKQLYDEDPALRQEQQPRYDHRQNGPAPATHQRPTCLEHIVDFSLEDGVHGRI